MNTNDVPAPSNLSSREAAISWMSRKVSLHVSVELETEANRAIGQARGPVAMILDPRAVEKNYVRREFLPGLKFHRAVDRVICFNAGERTDRPGLRGLLEKASRRELMAPEEGNRLWVIEGFEGVLNTSVADQYRMASLLAHLSREENVTVLLVSTVGHCEALSALPGMDFLGQASEPGVLQVPDDWSPPIVRTSKSPSIENATFHPYLYFAAAMVVALAMVAASMWVSTERLELIKGNPSPHRQATESFERSAKVTALNLAASAEIQSNDGLKKEDGKAKQ